MILLYYDIHGGGMSTTMLVDGSSICKLRDNDAAYESLAAQSPAFLIHHIKMAAARRLAFLPWPGTVRT